MNPHRSRQLRRLIADKTVLMPGAFNALVARAIEAVGFDALYISGAGLSNAVYALPDVGLVTLTEAAAHVKAVCSAVQIPVVVDADTGFGEAINAARTVQEFEAAGASGMHFEDQVLPKKCGHLDGKELIPAEAMAEKIRAACAARIDPDVLIIARTDARGVTSLDDAVARANLFLKAGADAIFPEALQNEDEFAAFATRVKAPLLANMTEFGKTPLLKADALSKMGYRMIIYPQTALRVGMAAITAMLADLMKNGDQTPWLPRMQSRADLYALLGYDGLEKIDRAVTGKK